MRISSKSIALSPYAKQLLRTLAQDSNKTMDNVIMELIRLHYKIRHKEVPDYKPENKED